MASAFGLEPSYDGRVNFSMETILFHYVTTWRIVGYSIVFLGLLVEGDAILFAAAFLTHQGFFDLGDMILVVFSGVLVGDSLWYWLGRKLTVSSNFFLRRLNHIAARFDEHLRNRPLRTIFTSKFAYGFHHAVLIRVGFVGIEWKELMKVDIVATLLWIIAVGGLGYFSSAAFTGAKHYLRIAEIGVLIAFILFFVLEYFITQRVKEKL